MREERGMYVSKKFERIEVNEARKRGRPRKRWEYWVKKNVREKGLMETNGELGPTGRRTYWIRMVN